jgi:4-hydroxy-4-methyl-2-oxoglutarate aldolase
MIYRDIPRIDSQLIAGLRGLAVADISDVLPATVGAAGLMRRSIGSVTPGLSVCGQAVTAFCAMGDGLIAHTALFLAKAGDVLVLSDGAGETRAALCGGNAAVDAKAQSIAGAVVDGAVRDVDTLRALAFPTWARAVTAAHGEKAGHGWVNKPISCGGVIVHPGDIVIGDDDGIIVFPPSYAEFVATEVRRIKERDAGVYKRIKAGERIFSIAKFDEKVAIRDGHWTDREEQP